MASAVCEHDFGSWLVDTLEKLSIDHEVFGTYITGILEAEDISDEEKSEALIGVIGGVTEEEIVETTCKEIISKWQKSEQATAENNVDDSPLESSETKMASIMEKHATTVVKKEINTNQSSAEKKRLIAKYGEVSEDEDENEVDDANADITTFKNRNAEDVVRQQREQREKDKSQHEQRKEQNRLQQEKQKQAALDRKEKEKKRTQKQEKHR
ncbi:coiled-coil domain-containing protein 43-like [Anneissia japonica]|uniref:coiled-coil domain-containing protein 43-like n=1 Tax=Anneissia japonica TaxID=1529436 RepID=UPI0014255F97|nr:coiled-coil domain-containing protein 43-like [Anneissia japonica]